MSKCPHCGHDLNQIVVDCPVGEQRGTTAGYQDSPKTWSRTPYTYIGMEVRKWTLMYNPSIGYASYIDDSKIEQTLSWFGLPNCPPDFEACMRIIGATIFN